jgi:hypothetical protein
MGGDSIDRRAGKCQELETGLWEMQGRKRGLLES